MEAAGIARKWVIWILIADQVMIIAMDLALGVAADRVVSGMRRLGPWIAGISVVSCLAFLLMPFTPGLGNGAPALLLGAIVLWSLTSSALRAPIIALLGKHASPSAATWLTNLALLGVGVAGALAPVLTVKLRGLDPRLPFVKAGAGLLIAVAAMGWAERRLDAHANASPVVQVAPDGQLGAAFFVAIALLCAGFQVHTSINSAPIFLRFAAPPMLVWLLAFFWIGFSLVIVPSAWLINRFGAATVLAIGAVLGAASLAAMDGAPNLALLTTLQTFCGAGWAPVIAGGISVAIAAGRSGREGRTSGRVFALLAAGAALRLTLVATELHKMPETADLLLSLPALFWSVAAVLCIIWLRGGGRPFGRRGMPLAASH